MSTSGPSQAQATVTDAFAGSPIPHEYQSGSLRVPPGFTPQWSTDAGVTWLNSEPGTASAVDAVRSSGLTAPGPAPGGAFPVIHTVSSVQVQAGDGWDVGFYGDDVYITPHHGPGHVLCFVKTSGTPCGDFAMGTNFWTSGVAGPGIDRSTGTLWEAGFSPATTDGVPSTGQVQLQCVTLAPVMQACANNAIPFGPTLSTFAQDVVSETTVVDGKVYFLYLAQPTGTSADPSAKSVLACWDPGLGPAGNYCAGTANGFFTLNLGSWQAFISGNGLTPSDVHTALWVQNGKLYLQNHGMGVTCWNPSNDTLCSGNWPVDLSQGAPFNPSQTGVHYGLVPRIVGGSEDGFCAIRVTPSVSVLCIDGNGAVGVPFPSGLITFPWVFPSLSWHGAVAFGTRVYIPQFGDDTVRCFDYATNGLCAKFPTKSLVQAYTVRNDPDRPGCLWANSNSRQVLAFDAFTGAECGKQQRFTVKPSSYYCDGVAPVTGYSTLSLTGLGAGDFTGATVTVADASGAPIPGFVNLPLPSANPTVSLSGIPYGPAVVFGGATRDTTSINVDLTFSSTLSSSSSWTAQPPPTLNITWDGPPIEPLCFKTTVPPSLCSASATGGVEMVTTGALTDAGGSTLLGPSTASFDYQQGRSCVREGTLRICKVAGAGVAEGARYTFTAGGSTVTVAAGPAPDGNCLPVPTPFPVDSEQVVQEAIPGGEQVSIIGVTPANKLVGSPDPASGRVTVLIGVEGTQVTYTNSARVSTSTSSSTTAIVRTTVLRAAPRKPLVRTGSETWPVVRTALLAISIGTVAVSGTRRRRRRTTPR